MKHSFEVKLAAVNHYLAGHAGIISTAKLFQLSQLENAVNEYITYWNQKRIKLSLGGLSPVEYRTEYQKAG